MRSSTYLQTLAFQIYIGIAGVLGILAVLFGLALSALEQRQQAFLLATVELVVDKIVMVYEFSIANELFIQNRDALQLVIQDMLNTEGVIGAGIFQADGTLLLGSKPALANLTEAERRQIPKPYQIIRRDWNQQPVLEYTRPIVIIGELQGYVRVYYNLTPIQHQQRLAVVLAVALFSALFVALFLLIRQLLNMLVIAPVSQLTTAMHAFESGSIGVQVAISSRNEMGMLAQAFNYMSQENARMYGALNELNKTLEQKVHDRTHDLEQEILERRQIEEALRQAKEAAESANRAKSTFLANMSHELRTPLNAILGFTQILARNPHTPEAHDHLAVIIRSSEHLLTLINQVLDLAKIESGRVTLHEQETDLFDLLDEVHDLFTLKAQQKCLRFTITRADDVPRIIFTDTVKLRQILINLIGNALKFTDTGHVTVRVWTPRALISGDRDATLRLIFEVEDTGPGMTPEEVETLFTAFTQTRTGQQAKEGTGLGLVISQQFVHLLGGDLRVNSVVGQGTAFSVAVLVSAVTSANRLSAPSQRQVLALAPDQPVYRLLIADDQPDNRRLLVTLLQPFGFELREAANGQESLIIWQQWQPHLIWLDLRMPDMSGYEVTRQIRAASADHQPKIVLVSASSFEEERSIALSKGCDDFLRKPFREHEIFDLLAKHLSIHFVYAEDDSAGAVSPTARTEALTPDALTALPEDVRRELRDAVDGLNIEATLAVLDRLRPQYAPLTEALADLVKRYRFDVLQQLVQEMSA